MDAAGSHGLFALRLNIGRVQRNSVVFVVFFFSWLLKLHFALEEGPLNISLNALGFDLGCLARLAKAAFVQTSSFIYVGFRTKAVLYYSQEFVRLSL